MGPEGEEVQKNYGKNIQKYTGKMLTAVFKDYLIYDDIYEFLEGWFSVKESKQIVFNYAANMNQIATVKYAFKQNDYSVNHENIINRPSALALNKRHQKILSNNLKLKYLMKYEKRVYHRNL